LILFNAALNLVLVLGKLIALAVFGELMGNESIVRSLPLSILFHLTP
jgi:hypothetical protein